MTSNTARLVAFSAVASALTASGFTAEPVAFGLHRNDRVSSTSSDSSPAAFWLHHQRTIPSSSTQRGALIYGWDEDGDDETTTTTTASYSPYSAMSIDPSPQCTELGIAVAESMSYDQDRVGSLARLAVAFSPPERALTLDQIEKVDVICVREEFIDIQAIICEDGGCVSLAVPIRFPYSCGMHNEWLEGCVQKNIEALDQSATSTIASNTASAAQDPMYNNDWLNDAAAPSSVDYPSWWVTASSYGPSMVVECDNMKSILNEAEFQTDIKALAQDSVHHAHEDEQYVVQQAKVSEVGLAGIAFSVRATDRWSPGQQQHSVLNVFYPFGGPALQTVNELRAAVLGAVATAEGQQ